MKSNATMHKIAKALAIELGPREYTTPSGKKIVGFFLTREELRGLFGREGFNVVSGNAWLNRIRGWEVFGDINPVGTTIFFLIPDTTLRVAVEKVALDRSIAEVIV